MSRTEGETRDERDALIGAVTAKVGAQWQEVVSGAMAGPGPWMPWMLVYNGPQGAGSYWLLSRPRPADVRHYRRIHGGLAAVVDVERCLRLHVEVVAAATVAAERSWPLEDEGPDAWLSA